MVVCGHFRHGSQGFCLLNNIAIGAAYARYNFAAVGIRKIAIVDFDVHHGNGTEQILLNVKPRERKLHVSVWHAYTGMHCEVVGWCCFMYYLT